MTKKHFLAGGGAAVLLLAAILLSHPPSSPQAAPPSRPSAPFDVGIPTAQEVRNMLAVYGERVESTERDLVVLRAELIETRKHFDEARKKDGSGLEKLLQDLQGTLRPEAPAPAGGPRFRTFEFDKRHGTSLHLPAGSFGEATLLTGVFAPVTGEALPVLLRLDAALVGPQRSRIPIRGAFLVGKAQGDANSRRAVLQLETLSLVRDDGAPVEVKVNGWAADDDGVQGLRGTYVWRAEEILALAGTTGALSAGSEAMAQRETTTQATPLGGFQGAVTGDPLKFAGYRGLSSAFERLSEAVGQRLNEITPAIHVANARRVTVAFINGVTLDGYEAPETSPAPFAGLDR